MKSDITQTKRLDYLIKAFGEETVQYQSLEAVSGREEKRALLRALMNIRMPGKAEAEVLRIQDEFLREEAQSRGIVTLADIPSIEEQYGSKKPFAHKLSVWQGDITRLGIDGIVNAANSRMLGCFIPCHRCIDNAIHSAAGIELREECSHIMQTKKMKYGAGYEEPTGQAVITKGYNLPARYVIHTVGPVVSGSLTDRLRRDLENCYKNVLKCAMENQVRSIAFCCISTGEFRFPGEEAARIAVDTVEKFLQENDRQFERVIFNVFRDADREIYKALLE